MAGLLSRYRAVMMAAWSARAELAGPSRLAEEREFLPAALKLQETPAHPAPRRFAASICAFFVLALTWSLVGEVDIVAVAPGRIVVMERTKTLQPLEASVVRRVLVEEGQSVHAGQLLVELDSTSAAADGASIHEQIEAAASEERRTVALLAALRGANAANLANGATKRDLAQLQAEWSDMIAKVGKLAAEQSRRRAEIETVREVIAKLEVTLPIARQREEDFRSLAEQGFMSGHATQDRARERIEMERDLSTQRARFAEARAALNESDLARVAFSAEMARTLNDRLAQASSKRQQLEQEHRKAEQRSRLTQLVSPVDGTVQQVAVHTEGGVVTPAQILMVIVPRIAATTAEVVVENKDIGFVNVGQRAVVKLEAFPFTRYGTIAATVKSLSADAVNDDKKGAVFPATVSLDQPDVVVDGKRIALSPGMNVSAEIQTGRQTIAEYLVSPVQRALKESLRER